MKSTLIAKTYEIKNLGEITGCVLKIMNKYNSEWYAIDEDLRAFSAPSECWGLAFEGFDKKFAEEVISAVSAFGIDYLLFKSELEERVDGKWLYMNLVDLPEGGEHLELY